MTTIITRAYAGKTKADAAAEALRKAGFLETMIDVVSGDGDVAAELVAAQVDEETAAEYAGALTNKQAVLIARVPVMPLGAARIASRIAGRAGPKVYSAT